MKFFTSTLLITPILGAFAIADASISCSTSANAPFAADCQIAVDGLQDIPLDCGTNIAIYSRIENSALSCSIRTYSESGNAHCLERSLVIAAAQKVINGCEFVGSFGGPRAEGIEEIAVGSGNYISVEWSACGGSCSTPL